MNAWPEGKTKFLILRPVLGCSSASVRRIPRGSAEIPQRNGSGTTSTGIALDACGASASNLVPKSLTPRFT